MGKFVAAKTSILTNIPIDIKLDANSYLRRLDPGTYRYIEDTHEVEILAPKCEADGKRTISSQTITHWRPPHEKEAITEEKKGEILAKVCEFFDKSGLKYKVE